MEIRKGQQVRGLFQLPPRIGERKRSFIEDGIVEDVWEDGFSVRYENLRAVDMLCLKYRMEDISRIVFLDKEQEEACDMDPLEMRRWDD